MLCWPLFANIITIFCLNIYVTRTQSSISDGVNLTSKIPLSFCNTTGSFKPKAQHIFFSHIYILLVLCFFYFILKHKCLKKVDITCIQPCSCPLSLYFSIDSFDQIFYTKSLLSYILSILTCLKSGCILMEQFLRNYETLTLCLSFMRENKIHTNA